MKRNTFSIRNKWRRVSVGTQWGFGLGLFSLFFSLPFVFIRLLAFGIAGLWWAIFLLFGILSGIVGLPLSICMFRRERSRGAKIGIILNSVAIFLYLVQLLFLKYLLKVLF